MTTGRQQLGKFGEERVVKHCSCPRCKRQRTLRRLPQNFKCADVICDFCGYLAQVKTHSTKDAIKIPSTLLGAAWRVQKERMDAGIYFPLFVVAVESKRRYAIYYLSADLQNPEMFLARRPLSGRARRAGWQGFVYKLGAAEKGAIVRIVLNGIKTAG